MGTLQGLDVLVKTANRLEVGRAARNKPRKEGLVHDHHVGPGIMYCFRRECVGSPQRRRCSVVDIANVPHDYEGSGASRWIAILGS